VQFVTVLLYIVLAITSLFLVCLVLIQRGKGGGLAGAFGGAGSSSAFGSKAGDVFTRVTMITATVWIALNMLLVVISNNRTSAWGPSTRPGASKTSEFTPSEKTDLDGLGKSGLGLDPLAIPPAPSAKPADPATVPAPSTAPAPTTAPAPATAPVPEVSGGSPAAPTPLPKDAPAPTPKP
jgi:preprotein translocase subunit SecG